MNRQKPVPLERTADPPAAEKNKKGKGSASKSGGRAQKKARGLPTAKRKAGVQLEPHPDGDQPADEGQAGSLSMDDAAEPPPAELRARRSGSTVKKGGSVSRKKRGRPRKSNAEDLPPQSDKSAEGRGKGETAFGQH